MGKVFGNESAGPGASTWYNESTGSWVQNGPAMQDQSHGNSATTTSGYDGPSAEASSASGSGSDHWSAQIQQAIENGDYAAMIAAMEHWQNDNNAINEDRIRRQEDFQREQNEQAQAWSASEAAKQREWQEYMSNTAAQRQVQDYIKAGLNPVLAASLGGSSTPSGSTGTAFSSQGSFTPADTSGLNGIVSLLGKIIESNSAMARTVVQEEGATNRNYANISQDKYRLNFEEHLKDKYPSNEIESKWKIARDTMDAISSSLDIPGSDNFVKQIMSWTNAIYDETGDDSVRVDIQNALRSIIEFTVLKMPKAISSVVSKISAMISDCKDPNTDELEVKKLFPWLKDEFGYALGHSEESHG